MTRSAPFRSTDRKKSPISDKLFHIPEFSQGSEEEENSAAAAAAAAAAAGQVNKQADPMTL